MSLGMQGSTAELREAAFSHASHRVLHINYGKLYGGVETVLITLAKFRSLCPDMEPCFALCETGRLSDELTQAGVAVYILGNVRISRPWTVWRARRRLKEILRRESFEVVVCHMPWSLAVFGETVKAGGKALAFWAHGFHTGRGWLERLARLRKPDLAIANSCFTESGLANLFPGIPSQIIHYPVALLDYFERPECRAAVRREHGVGAETVVVIQVSRLENWKGHLLHLEALALLKDSANWVCWIVGGPQNPREEGYFERLKETASELGIGQQVEFLGQRADVPRLLSAADIFCQPNLGPEPFGIVFIEALWAGLPVVTTALGGALEIVTDTCGVLVKPDAPIELAASLRRLIQSAETRVRLANAAPRRARELCDPAQQMATLSSFLNRTI